MCSATASPPWHDDTFKALRSVVLQTWPADLSQQTRGALLQLYRRVADLECEHPQDGFAAALAALPAAWVERDEQGRLVGIAGLSRKATAHRIVAGAPGIYGWCAWDCLFIPELLGREIVFETTCPHTGALLRVTVAPHGVKQMDPPGAMLTFARVGPADFEAGLRDAFCAHVRLCASEEAAAAFAAGHPCRTVISVAGAFALGELRNHTVLGDF